MRADIAGWGLVALELLYRTARGTDSPASSMSALWQRGNECLDELTRRKIDSLLYVRCRPQNPSQRLYDKVWRIQRETLQDALTASGRSGISPVVFKGAEFLSAYFDPHSLGILIDVDLLVESHHLAPLKRTLLTSGFRQAYFDVEQRCLVDTDLADVAHHELHHYELSPFTCLRGISLDEEEVAVARARSGQPLWFVDGECHLIIEIDVHRRVVADIDSDELFIRSVPSSFGAGRTLCAADHLWLTASRYYNEVAIFGKTSLRDLAYLALLLRGAEIDWDGLLQAAHTHAIEPSLYYFLSFLDHLAGNRVPEAVLVELDPRRGERQRDWGWQLGKLFGGVEPFFLREPIRSFVGSE